MKQETSIQLLKKDIKEIRSDIQDLKESMDKSFLELKKNIEEVKSCYVRNERFNPIEKGVYVILSSIVLSLLGAFLSGVMK